MKKIIALLCFLAYNNSANAQSTEDNITAQHWCIENLLLQTDSAGPHISLTIYNNDPALIDTLGWGWMNFIQIEKLLLYGSDPVLVFDESTYQSIATPSYIDIHSDTTITIRIDTVIDFSHIAGIVIQRGLPSCGIYWRERIAINASCGPNHLIDTSLLSLMSINDSQAELAVMLSPNPASDEIIIQTPTEKQTQVQVFTLEGKMVLQTKLTSNRNINVKHLARGTYLVVVDGKKAQKIILQ